MHYTATYSPEDNKLRLYASQRLDAETWAALKAAGFKWAPRQELFVAPMWTPEREDAVLALAGEIEDEDKSLVERQEERAERFEGLSDKRAADAENVRKGVDQIAERFYGGQPILVGHHSEKRARKDQERIHNGMRKVVNLWETSSYWSMRAEGALRLAKYKERPDVRFRRIKGIESDERKILKHLAELAKLQKFWASNPSMEKALAVANCVDRGFITLDNGERYWSLWSALTDGKVSLESVIEQRARKLPATIARNQRWLAHYQNRLVFERAMLGQSGWAPPVKPKRALLPAANYDHAEAYKMTAAQWAGLPKDYRGFRPIKAGEKFAAHRQPVAMGTFVQRAGVDLGGKFAHTYVHVFITDKPVKLPPAADGAPPVVMPRREPAVVGQGPTKPRRKVPDDVVAMKAALKAGNAVQVVVAPQLFPTPAAIAAKMVSEAAIEPGMCVLEPSAGTGNLVKAVLDTVDTEVLGYEINRGLCSQLERAFPGHKLQVRCRDFLEVTDFQGQYPRVVMNPPFENGADIKHIKHALTFVAPGGRLVALCAAGSRQKAFADEVGASWEDLPAGSFKEQGTSVNVAMIVVDV